MRQLHLKVGYFNGLKRGRILKTEQILIHELIGVLDAELLLALVILILFLLLSWQNRRISLFNDCI